MTPENADKLVARLSAIYARVRELEGAGNEIAAARQIVASASAFDLSKEVLSRIQSVRTARGGLEYAVWTMGEAVALADGMEALEAIYAAFEARHDDRAGVWLDRRWSGVSDGSSIWAC